MTSRMMATMNTSTDVSGVCVRQIPGIGDGGDCSTMATMTTRRGGWIASHPRDDGDARASGKTVFRRHPVCVGGLLV